MQHKMRLSIHLSALQLTFLFLALLCPTLPTASAHLQSTSGLPPITDRRDLESTLQQIYSALGDPRETKRLPEGSQDHLPALLEPWEQEEEENGEPWVEETLLRAQRGDLTDLPEPLFPGDNSLESVHYQEGEEGLKRNDALTSMAGGLQAVSREKGGFGFRFGRKRWTGRGQRDEEVRGEY